MRINYLLLLLILLATHAVWAQNHLVTHNFIRQKVTEGYFTQKPGTTIPQDNFCISKTEAMSWLVLNESRLPSDNRMPWWSELIPPTVYSTCPYANFEVCAFSSGVYSSCGSWLYEEGFNVNLNSYTRRQIGPGNPFWIGSPTDKQAYCNFTPASTKSSLMALNNVSGEATSTNTDTSSGTMAPMNMTLNSFLGPLNRCGIWDCSNSPDTEDWVYVSGTIAASATKTYYIGAAADNLFHIYVDGILVAAYDTEDGEAFKLWHVFPVELTQGIHTIKFETQNKGGEAVMGCEVYDNTEAELDAAQSYSDLNILFTTQGLSNNSLCSSHEPYAIDVSVWGSAGCITGIYGLTGYTVSSDICGYDGGTYTDYEDAIYIEVSVPGIQTLTVMSDYTSQSQPIYGSGVYSFNMVGIQKADLQIYLQ